MDEPLHHSHVSTCKRKWLHIYHALKPVCYEIILCGGTNKNVYHTEVSLLHSEVTKFRALKRTHNIYYTL